MNTSGRTARRRTSIARYRFSQKARRLVRRIPKSRRFPVVCLLLITHACVFALGACALRPAAARREAVIEGLELTRQGDEIIACGRLFHTGTRVVLWTDPGGYDAYRVQRRFSQRDRTLPSRPVEGANTPMRYSPVRDGLPDDIAARVRHIGWSLADLQQVVDQFVIHYDVAGTSRRCFEVLQDERGLSVHFMLDVDGTIYQTLDLKERARHAAGANDRSIGVEIAQMGAYADAASLSKWYQADSNGAPRLILPRDWHGPDTDEAPVLHSARTELIRGRINGEDLVQYDFTPQQYAALGQLTATLARIFPRMRMEVPRDASGHVRNSALSERELAGYRGILGHYHVTTNKNDPGPAFDWERLLADVRRLGRG